MDDRKEFLLKYFPNRYNENLLRPCRLFILGASHTGKTELFKRMLLKNDFGDITKISLLIYAPSELTLKQKCYKDLEKKLFEVKKSIINKTKGT